MSEEKNKKGKKVKIDLGNTIIKPSNNLKPKIDNNSKKQ
jgi:hypothetical protein